MMERLFTGTSVVFIWGAYDAFLVAVLANFTSPRLTDGSGSSGGLAFDIYAASTTIVFIAALAVWVGRRRARERSPRRAVSALLLAVGMTMAGVGLAVGAWAAYLAAAVVMAALAFEFYPGPGPAE